MVGPNMELRHLRYFIAVAELENVTRAAAQLHISQPPLTRQIQDLEEELGLALFERKGKSIRLTPSGHVFLAEARACLERIETAVRAVRASAGASELHLGYAPSPTVEILPRFLQALAQKCRGASVTLHDHSSPEMLAGLRAGRLLAALMMQPSRFAARGISFTILRTYPVGIAVPPGHPLARKPAIPVRDLQSEPLVVYSRRDFPDYHRFLARAAGSFARRLTIAHECDSGASLAAAVESGKGICITGSFLTAGVGHRLKFVPIHPAPSPAVVGLALVSDRVPPAARSLLEQICAEF